MNPALQDAIKEAFAIAPANKVVLHTLEIRQVGVQESVFIAKTRHGFTAIDEDGDAHYYEPSGFEFTLPPSTDEGFQSLNLAIDNIGQRVSDWVNTARQYDTPVEVIYRPYINDDLSQPVMNPPLVLYLRDIKVNALQVSGRATFMDIVNKKFPLELYTRERFPALG